MAKGENERQLKTMGPSSLTQASQKLFIRIFLCWIQASTNAFSTTSELNLVPLLSVPVPYQSTDFTAT
jgi:hypothetical protein